MEIILKSHTFGIVHCLLVFLFRYLKSILFSKLGQLILCWSQIRQGFIILFQFFLLILTEFSMEVPFSFINNFLYLRYLLLTGWVIEVNWRTRVICGSRDGTVEQLLGRNWLLKTLSLIEVRTVSQASSIVDALLNVVELRLRLLLLNEWNHLRLLKEYLLLRGVL